MIIRVCDPATDLKDRGFATIFNGELMGYSNSPPVDPRLGDWSVVEAQFANPKASRQSLLTLGARAGFCFTLIPAQRYAMIPPTRTKMRVKGKRAPQTVRGWKEIILPRCAGMPGDVFTRNLRQWLDKRGIASGEQNHNILDAIGLALAAWQIRDELPNYEIE